MRALLVQSNPTVGALEENARALLDAIEDGERNGADVVLCPELAITGYPPRDLLLNRAFIQENRERAHAVAARSGRAAVVFGFVDRDEEGRLFNAAAVASEGRLVGVAHKVLLPTYDVFDEARYFRPGATPLLTTIAGRKVGIAICEDVWNDAEFWGQSAYEREPVGELARRGMEMLLVLSASPFSTGRRTERVEMMRSFARRHSVPVAYLNQTGGNDELVFDGSSFALDARGGLLGMCTPFRDERRLFDLDEKGTASLPARSDAELGHEALTLGLRDYVRKCRFTSVVIGLSGGIDSALVASLAVEALGAANVTCVFMPSRFTSAESREDAEAIAKALGVRLLNLPIDPAYAATLETLAPVFAGRPFSTAEENLQARIRGNLLMALSNKFGWLVLSTGNKSELAVGYCTLYGDMSGGLAVISNLPKGMVYEVARVANAHKPAIPERVFSKAPTAELRPNQKDEDSLPPYPVLDAILKAYVEDGLPADEVAALGHDAELVARVIGMVDRNEYKRGQAAPGLRVTTKAFGIGRRMPIAADYTGGTRLGTPGAGARR